MENRTLYTMSGNLVRNFYKFLYCNDLKFLLLFVVMKVCFFQVEILQEFIQCRNDNSYNFR